MCAHLSTIVLLCVAALHTLYQLIHLQYILGFREERTFFWEMDFFCLKKLYFFVEFILTLKTGLKSVRLKRYSWIHLMESGYNWKRISWQSKKLGRECVNVQSQKQAPLPGPLWAEQQAGAKPPSRTVRFTFRGWAHQLELACGRTSLLPGSQSKIGI